MMSILGRGKRLRITMVIVVIFSLQVFLIHCDILEIIVH
jgi:hypothetical protein